MEASNYDLPVDPSTDDIQDLENELGNFGGRDVNSNDDVDDYDDDLEDDEAALMDYDLIDGTAMGVEKQEEDRRVPNDNNSNNSNYVNNKNTNANNNNLLDRSTMMTVPTEQVTKVMAQTSGENTEDLPAKSTFPSSIGNVSATVTTITNANDINFNNNDSDDDKGVNYKNSAAAFFGADVDSVWNYNRRKKKQKARLGKTAGMILPPEIQDPLNKGLLLFYAGDYDSAIPFLKTVILRAPKLPDPYQTLGMICEYRGDKKLALQYYIRTASYTKLGFSHYRKFISVAMEVEDYKTAHFGLTYLVKHQPDENVYKQKIVLYVMTNDIKNSMNMLRRFLVEYPGQFDVLMDFADACKLNHEKYMKFALEGYLTYCLLFLDHQKLLNVTKEFCTHDMLGKPKIRKWKRKTSTTTTASGNHNDSDDDSEDYDEEGKDSSNIHQNNEKGEKAEKGEKPLRWDFACLFYACSQAADILMSSHSPFSAEEACDIAMNLMHTLIDVVKQYNEHQKYLQTKKNDELRNIRAVVEAASTDSTAPQLAVTPPISLLYGLNNLRKSVIKKEKRYELTGLQVLVPVMQKLNDQDSRIKAAFEATFVNNSDNHDNQEKLDESEQKQESGDSPEEKTGAMKEAKAKVEDKSNTFTQNDVEVEVYADSNAKLGNGMNVADMKDEKSNPDSKTETISDADAKVDSSIDDAKDDDEEEEEEEEEEDGDAIDTDELGIAKHQAKFLLRLRLNAIDMLFTLGKKTQAARMLVEIVKNHVEFYCYDDIVPTRLKVDDEVVIIGLFSKKERLEFYKEIEEYFYKFSLNEVLWSKILWHLLEYDQDQPEYLYRCCFLARTAFPDQVHDIKNYMNLHILNLLTCITCTPAELQARDELPDQSVAISANALKDISYNVDTLYYEANTIIEFAKLVYNEDRFSFISMVLPVLEAWSGLGVYISKKKVELRHMNEVNRKMNYTFKNFLDETQNALWRMVRVLCAFVPVTTSIVADDEGEYLTRLVYEMIITTNDAGEQYININLPYSKTIHEIVVHIKKKGFLKEIPILPFEIPSVARKKRKKMQSNGDQNLSVPVLSSDTPRSNMLPTAPIPNNSSISSMVVPTYVEPSSKKRRVKAIRKGQIGPEEMGHRALMDIRDLVDGILPQSEAVSAAILIKEDPFSIAASNILSKSFLTEAEMRPPNSILMEQSLPVTQYRRQEQQSLPFTLMSAHVQNIDRRHAEACQIYFESFCIDSSQPLNSLCLAKQLIFLSKHWLVLNRHETFVKAMACAMRYQRDRLTKFKTELLEAVDVEMIDINEASIKQEILYNLARLFDESNLPHLSIGLYYKVLDLHDQIPKNKFNLTSEAAYNLMIIFKRSGAKELALEIMKKHLTF